jgi:hypothetical protein
MMEGERETGEAQPSEEEMRARIEDQIRKLRVEDLMIESIASVLNLTARRIAKEDERDLEQARIGIEAVKAWLEFLPEEAAKQVRAALSELQMLYAKQSEDGEGPEDENGGDEGGGGPEPGQEPRRGPEPPPRLWTPPSAS